jgi:DNA repair exonuclease SbcCD nuclease subunit
MRLLHLADIHLDTPFAWASPELARRCRLDLREALAAAVHLGAELAVDAMTIAGDLYEHDRITPDTAAFLATLFADVAPLPVFLAPGNHDPLCADGVYALQRWTPNVHLFRTAALTPVRLADGLTLWGAAHLTPAGTAGFLDGFRVEGGGVHLALFHGSERGALAFQGDGKAPHAPFDAAQILDAGLHHALTGHYHTPRAATHHTYPGNPAPLTFGEHGERGAVIVTVAPDGTVEREWHGAVRSPWHDIDVDLGGVATTSEAQSRVVAALAGLTGIARVTVAGEVGADLDLQLADLRGLPSGLGDYVVRLGRIDVAYDLDALRGEPTVRGQFVRDLLDSTDLDDDTRRRVLHTGLRALDGRRDLEVA